MGVVWSSPYRWQLLAVCFGLFVLTTGLVFLLLSIGLEDDLWRLMGGICASMGSALAVTGTCWCVWVVRHGRYGDGIAISVPDCEAETLTGDAAQWHDNVGADRDQRIHKGGFYQDIDDMETDDDAEYDDDDDEEAEDDFEEEECESEGTEMNNEKTNQSNNMISSIEEINKCIIEKPKCQNVAINQGQTESTKKMILKESVKERLIPV